HRELPSFPTRRSSDLNRVVTPGRRDARVDHECLATASETKDVFESRPIHPAGRSRIPGPPAAARMASARVYISGDDMVLSCRERSEEHTSELQSLTNI